MNLARVNSMIELQERLVQQLSTLHNLPSTDLPQRYQYDKIQRVINTLSEKMVEELETPDKEYRIGEVLHD